MSRKADGSRRTGADKARERYALNGKYGRSKVEAKGLVEATEYVPRPVGKPKSRKPGAPAAKADDDHANMPPALRKQLSDEGRRLLRISLRRAFRSLCKE